MSLLNELHKRLGAKRAVARAARTAGARAAAAVPAPCTAPRSRCAGRSRGFTITEALTTLIIVGLVTGILAGGVALATRQYAQSMSSSEAQMLYSSLQQILDTELRYAKTIVVSNEGAQLIGFHSKHYTAKTGTEGGNGAVLLCTTPGGVGSTEANPPSTPGQLGLATKIGQGAVVNTFLGEGAYNYGLQVRVTSFEYRKDERLFKIGLAVSRGEDSTTLAGGTFTVHALNVANAVDANGSDVSGQV